MLASDYKPEMHDLKANDNLADAHYSDQLGLLVAFDLGSFHPQPSISIL